MKNRIARCAVAMILAALALSGSALALFGKKGPEPASVRELEIRTYRGIPYQARFPAADGEGLTFAVVDQPKKGAVTIEGTNFTYTPNDGASGGDSFTYAATDSQGRTSPPAAVTVTIEKAKSGVTYGDMSGSAAAAAAQELAEAGIFTGARIGEQYYFEPDCPVSREEFLAMVLETAGRNVTAVTMTGFCDDGAIPAWAKAYAAAGAADGIVYGSATAEGAAFRGGDAITFNAAAAILDRMLDLDDVDLDVWYADRDEIPSWAAQAVGNLEAFSVLAAGSFGSATMEAPVTRADAALMLSAARTLLDGQEEKASGLFGWLK